MPTVRSLASTAVAVLLLLTAVAVFAASAEKGKAAYVKNGCWQCHGFMGQGGLAGPKIAPDPIPLPRLTAFLRSSNGAMPPYQEAVLSNEDLADIYAYMQSIPKPADYQSIPLLNPR
jgi:mono/diheme cytochrome c family protein